MSKHRLEGQWKGGKDGEERETEREILNAARKKVCFTFKGAVIRLKSDFISFGDSTKLDFFSPEK